MAARVARLGIRISGDRRRRFAKRGTYSNAALRKSMHGLWLRTGCHASRAKTWIQAWGKIGIKKAWAAPGPERASPIRRSNPGLDSGPLGWPLYSNAQRVSSLHLSEGCLNLASRSDTYFFRVRSSLPAARPAADLSDKMGFRSSGTRSRRSCRQGLPNQGDARRRAAQPVPHWQASSSTRPGTG